MPSGPGRAFSVLNARLSELPGARLLVPRFGASDCRCPGHLVYLPRRPLDREIERALASASPNVRTPPVKGRP